MQVDVLTLFPEMFGGAMNTSMMWKARDRALLDLRLHNIRDWSLDKHRTVDDTPYGGGGGMLMRVDVMHAAVKAVIGDDRPPVIFMSPQGRLLSHQVAAELAQYPRIVLLCGHYEGIDERARELFITDEISIGEIGRASCRERVWAGEGA